MASVWQEIACRREGQGCGGFIIIKLNVNMNRRVMIICPKCQHKHERVVSDGVVVDDSYRGKHVQETFTPLMSAYSEKPCTKEMQLTNGAGWGHGKVIPEDEIVKSGSTLHQSWIGKFTGRFLGKG